MLKKITNFFCKTCKLLFDLFKVSAYLTLFSISPKLLQITSSTLVVYFRNVADSFLKK